MISIPGEITLSELRAIYRDGLSVSLDISARAPIAAAADLVAKAAMGTDPVSNIFINELEKCDDNMQYLDFMHEEFGTEPNN